ncbi:Anaphase-promoting complex subunit 1, partial [Physocladia obscura]
SVLVILSHKILALPVGRAIFTFSTGAPTTIPETALFPQVIVSAKLPPIHDQVHLDLAAANPTLPATYMDWPNFHNGVAVGLRIPIESSHVTAEWIVQNLLSRVGTNTIATANSAGLAYALGLGMHLRKLEQWQLVIYMQMQHSLTSVGILLGISASYLGAGGRDEDAAFVTRVLGVHVPRLKDFGGMGNVVTGENGDGGNSDVIVEASDGGETYSAAVLGLGLVHLGTARRRYVEILVDEVGAVDYISGDEGGNSGSFNERAKNREGHSVAAGLGLGMLVLGKGGSSDLTNLDGVNLLERILGYVSMVKGKTRQDTKNDGGSDVSAAGATLALGLMYLKTNNAVVADKIRIPETSHFLDYVRSDLLLIRTLARNLIMWDSISPSETWIENQIPDYIKKADSFLDEDDGSLESLRHARYNILAGVCLSLAIKYAGSSNAAASKIIMKYLDFFQRESGFPAISFREKLNKSVVRSCFDVVVTCLGVVMAGTGDIAILRRLHPLTDRIAAHVSYGSHMAVQMSLGFLFLGAGSGLTFGTSNTCVAALVCALYPRFPMSADDNRCHLQAFRHLWVIAVEKRRSFVVRDVGTRIACSIPILVSIKGAVQELEMIAPCILPDLETVDCIRINSNRYLPLTLEIGNNEDQQKDPNGNLGIMSRTFPDMKKVPKNNLKRKNTNPPFDDHNEFLSFILTSFSQDPRVLAFAQYFCTDLNSNKGPDAGMPNFCLNVLHECLIQDKADILELYLEIYMIFKHAVYRLTPNLIYEFEIICAFYEFFYRAENNWMRMKPALLNYIFVESIQHRIDQFFALIAHNNMNSQDENDIGILVVPYPSSDISLAVAFKAHQKLLPLRFAAEIADEFIKSTELLLTEDDLATEILKEILHNEIL